MKMTMEDAIIIERLLLEQAADDADAEAEALEEQERQRYEEEMEEMYTRDCITSLAEAMAALCERPADVPEAP